MRRREFIARVGAAATTTSRQRTGDRCQRALAADEIVEIMPIPRIGLQSGFLCTRPREQVNAPLACRNP
jgi:hypothetical protein